MKKKIPQTKIEGMEQAYCANLQQCKDCWELGFLCCAHNMPSEDKKAETDEDSNLLSNWRLGLLGCFATKHPQTFTATLIRDLLRAQAARTREEDIEAIKKLKDKDWFHHPDNALECAINTLKSLKT